MARIKHIKIYECGHEEVKSEFEMPGETSDIMEHLERPCMTCLTKQWREDKEKGFSLKDIFHRLMQEENTSQLVNDEEESEDIEGES